VILHFAGVQCIWHSGGVYLFQSLCGFSMENWLAFKKLETLTKMTKRQSGDVEPGSNPPEEASGINAIRFSLFHFPCFNNQHEL